MSGLPMSPKIMASILIHLITYHRAKFVKWIMEIYFSEMLGKADIDRLDIAGDTLQRLVFELTAIRDEKPNAD